MLRALHYRTSFAGTGRARLVYATDHKIYVLKAADNPLDMRAAATEMIASALAGAIDLPVPRVALIEIPAELRRSDPHPTMSSGGPHLAIEFAAQSPHGRSFDFFPTTRLAALENLEAFIVAAVFDGWVQRRKSRQAVFLRASADARYRVVFINQRSSFNNATWTLTDEVEPAWYMDHHAYDQPVWHDRLEHAITQIQGLSSQKILSCFKDLPGEWATRHELRSLAEQLVWRQASMRRIIAAFTQFKKLSATA